MRGRCGGTTGAGSRRIPAARMRASSRKRSSGVGTERGAGCVHLVEGEAHSNLHLATGGCLAEKNSLPVYYTERFRCVGKRCARIESGEGARPCVSHREVPGASRG